MSWDLSKPLPGDETALRRLRRAWWVWWLAGLGALAAGAALLSKELGLGLAGWFGVNLLALGGVMGFVWSLLGRHRRTTDGPVLAVLGPGNHLTILRGVLIAQLPGYLLFPWPGGWLAWLPALTYGTVQAADYLDGYLARRAHLTTPLGERLDIEFDGLGLMLATALAVHYGQLPAVYFFTVGIARYLFLAVGWWVQRTGRPTRPLPPSATRRGLAGVVMELGVAALWPIAPASMMTLAGVLVGVPVLVGFVRDTLVYVGALAPEAPRYRRLRDQAVRFASRIAPPFLRAALLLLLGPVLVARWAATDLRLIPLLLETLFLGMIVLGLAGRAGAAGMVVVFGLELAFGGVSPEGLAAWGLAVAIYLAGTGAGSLWQPELVLVTRRAGERR